MNKQTKYLILFFLLYCITSNLVIGITPAEEKAMTPSIEVGIKGGLGCTIYMTNYEEEMQTATYSIESYGIFTSHKIIDRASTFSCSGSEQGFTYGFTYYPVVSFHPFQRVTASVSCGSQSVTRSGFVILTNFFIFF